MSWRQELKALSYLSKLALSDTARTDKRADLRTMGEGIGVSFIALKLRTGFLSLLLVVGNAVVSDLCALQLKLALSSKRHAAPINYRNVFPYSAAGEAFEILEYPILFAMLAVPARSRTVISELSMEALLLHSYRLAGPRN